MTQAQSKNTWVDDLGALVGSSVFDTSEAARHGHGVDCWPVAVKMRMQGKWPFAPEGVARPQSAEQVATILRFAGARRVPVTPWGAGSGVTGAALATRGGIALDLSGMQQIIDLNERNLTVRAETGVMGHELERHLNERGFTLNHSPQSLARSTVGGWVATAATGQLSSKYGGIEDLLVACRIVLPDGEIVDTRATPRSAVGPDLRKLFIGTEGCIGVVVEVTLKIFALSAHHIHEALTFERLGDGLEALRLIARNGIRPHIARYYDIEEARHVTGDRGYAHNLLLLGFDGIAEIATAEHRAARALAETQGGTAIGPAPVERWIARRFDFSAVERLLTEPGGFAETIEVAHFWDGIEATYEALKRRLAPHADEVLGHFSHLYPQGTSLYTIILGREGSDAEAEHRLRLIWEAAMEACLETGATISHHHGVGIARDAYVRRDLGSAMRVLERLKQAFDPHAIMNPGKLGLGRAG